MFFLWEGVSQNSKFSQFQIFPKLGLRGVIKFPFFSKFKKIKIIKGEGVKKIAYFFHFLWHFLIWRLLLFNLRVGHPDPSFPLFQAKPESCFHWKLLNELFVIFLLKVAIIPVGVHPTHQSHNRKRKWKKSTSAAI